MEAPSSREPHSISLKVLRLSRPSLAQHFPIPLLDRESESQAGISGKGDTFLLQPSLTLPPSFGTAYVGEPFSCALCANNELDGQSEKQVSNVKLAADMQSPSGTVALELTPSETIKGIFDIRQSLQRSVRYDLREEGSHTLSVNVSYSETTLLKDQAASSGRIRTFRKLYQFVARPCLNVRTKVSILPEVHGSDAQILALEAQIDNLSDTAIVLKSVAFNTKAAFQPTSVNWDAYPPNEDETSNCPIMAPRDVHQVAFLVREVEGVRKEVTRDGKTALGQLGLRWWSQMGEEGFLTTGILTTKRR